MQAQAERVQPKADWRLPTGKSFRICRTTHSSMGLSANSLIILRKYRRNRRYRSLRAVIVRRISVFRGLFGAVDDRDLDFARTRLQFQAELRLHGVEDGRAGFETRVAVDRAEQPELEAAGDAGAVDDRPLGHAPQKIRELPERPGPA